MKKIALIVDADDWAFANIANSIKANIKKYEFKIIPLYYFDQNRVRGIIYANDCDLIHFFWREDLLIYKEEKFQWYIRVLGIPSLEEFENNYINNKIISTCVYDHLLLDEKVEKTKEIFNKYSNYYVCSNILKDIYDKLDINNKPKCVITDGVDLECFYPINEERFKNIKKRNLVIGWVGNSAWMNGIEDFKGVHTILKPAIEELKKEGYNIEECFADSQIGMIPHDKMVEYYSKIDVLVCTSKCEGTPNPVLEAMACGVPVISTRVGIVPDALGNKQSKYILKERTKDCFKETLKEFINNLDSIDELRNENKKQIKDWSWKKICKKFEKYFDECFEGSVNNEGSGKIK